MGSGLALESPVPRTGRNRRLEFVKDENVLNSYLHDIRKAKKMTLAEERVLAVRIVGGDKEAINILVEANLKFVVAVCRNYRYQGMEMGDLINEGNLGLMRAAQRFDGTMNFKFISYAVWWIRQGILAALANQSRVLNLSPSKVGTIYKIGKASQRLAQSLGRQPTLSEVAKEMEVSEKEVVECLQLASAPLSMDRPAKGEEDGSLMDSLPDNNSERADESACKSLFTKNMTTLLGTLEEREEKVLRLYYGVGTQGTATLSEIASHFDLTRERIRQIKEKALKKLRHPSREKQLTALRY